MKLADQLKKHPKIKVVYYPGDPEHLDYEIMKRQMRKGGRLLSFEVDVTYEDTVKVVNRL